MSTKTTFKRVALVAVAALGFGMLSVVPSGAAAVVEGATTGFTTNTSSITLIDAVGTADTTYGVFEVSLSNISGVAGKLKSDETLTATVISDPKPNAVAGTTATDDLKLEWATSWSAATGLVATSAGAVRTASFRGDAASNVNPGTGAVQDTNLAASLRGGKGTVTSYVLDDSLSTATYALKVSSDDADSRDAGTYQIRISVIDSNGNSIQSSIVKFAVASSKLTSGAVLTATATGSQLSNSAILVSATQNIKATVADANGGLIREGANGEAVISGSVKDAGDDATPTAYVTNTLTFTDAGVSTATTGTTLATRVMLNGTYEAAGTLGATFAAGTATITVRYGDASATASLTVTTTAGTKYANTSVSATGSVKNATTTTNRDLPLTTKSAKVTLTAYTGADLVTTTSPATTLGGYTVYYTLAYTGCVLGDMAPAAVGTPTKAITDANGQFAVEITNANPIDGCSVAVTFSGATVVTTAADGVEKTLTRTFNWTKPTPTSALVSPAGAYSAVLASTHKVTWTILDQFSTPVVGSTVTFSHSGANKPAATTSAPSAISDANGQVSYSWTDAKGVVDSTTLGFDTVALAQVGTTAFAKGSIKVTYVTTMPAIASLYSTYTATNAAGTLITGLVPTTAIGGVTGVLTSTADQIDSAKPVTGATTGAWVQLNFQARKAAATTGTAGVPTTVTVTGAQLIGNDGKLGNTVTVYANENVHVLGTAAGTATVTATNGTLTSTATINFINASTDARVLKLTEAAGLVTATVTDAFGSAVKGVDVDVVGSGGAWLGNGATSAAFKTATDGTVTFSVTGAGTVTASLSSTYTKASFLAGAGNTTGTVITTGAPAGVRSASVATTGNNVTSDAATAAADAAAEATDAANAATDAANAAAEAADAATAAAQDAADAVAALSTQVSEMVNALKKQITALTNLVIKIQKKVRA
jgi:trimeric autotransporter adhesin